MTTNYTDAGSIELVVNQNNINDNSICLAEINLWKEYFQALKINENSYKNLLSYLKSLIEKQKRDKSDIIAKRLMIYQKYIFEYCNQNKEKIINTELDILDVIHQETKDDFIKNIPDCFLNDKKNSLQFSIDANINNNILFYPLYLQKIELEQNVKEFREEHGGEIVRYAILGERIGSGGGGSIYRAEKVLILEKKNGNNVIRIKPKKNLLIKISNNEISKEQISTEQGFAHQFLLSPRKYTSLKTTFLLYEKKEKDLFTVLQNNLTTKQRIEICLGILYRLKEMHDKGAVHRDLKPENIMVDISKSPVFVEIIDFGLTEKINKGQKSQLAGTPFYARYDIDSEAKQHLDSRPDLYSAGLIIAELFGENPQYEGAKNIDKNDIIQIVSKTMTISQDILNETQKFTFEQNKCEGIDVNSLEELVKKMTKKDSDEDISLAINDLEVIQRNYYANLQSLNTNINLNSYNNAIEARKKGDYIEYVGHYADIENSESNNIEIAKQFKENLVNLLYALDYAEQYPNEAVSKKLIILKSETKMILDKVHSGAFDVNDFKEANNLFNNDLKQVITSINQFRVTNDIHILPLIYTAETSKNLYSEQISDHLMNEISINSFKSENSQEKQLKLGGKEVLNNFLNQMLSNDGGKDDKDDDKSISENTLINKTKLLIEKIKNEKNIDARNGYAKLLDEYFENNTIITGNFTKKKIYNNKKIDPSNIANDSTNSTVIQLNRKLLETKEELFGIEITSFVNQENLNNKSDYATIYNKKDDNKFKLEINGKPIEQNNHLQDLATIKKQLLILISHIESIKGSIPSGLKKIKSILSNKFTEKELTEIKKIAIHRLNMLFRPTNRLIETKTIYQQLANIDLKNPINDNSIFSYKDDPIDHLYKKIPGGSKKFFDLFKNIKAHVDEIKANQFFVPTGIYEIEQILKVAEKRGLKKPVFMAIGEIAKKRLSIDKQRSGNLTQFYEELKSLMDNPSYLDSETFLTDHNFTKKFPLLSYPPKSSVKSSDHSNVWLSIK